MLYLVTQSRPIVSGSGFDTVVVGVFSSQGVADRAAELDSLAPIGTFTQVTELELDTKTLVFLDN